MLLDLALDGRQFAGNRLQQRLKRALDQRRAGQAQPVLLLELGLEYLIKLAERHGLFVSEQLVEYAAFAVGGSIKLKPMIVPNFHFYDHPEFVRRWEAVERGEPPVISPITTRLPPLQ